MSKSGRRGKKGDLGLRERGMALIQLVYNTYRAKPKFR